MLRKRGYVVEAMGSKESHSFKTWDDPWKAMSPEDRKEANRLFKAGMKVLAGSPKQKEIHAALFALLKKYGIGNGKDLHSEGDLMLRKRGYIVESGKRQAANPENEKLAGLLKKFCSKHGKVHPDGTCELDTKLGPVFVSVPKWSGRGVMGRVEVFQRFKNPVEREDAKKYGFSFVYTPADSSVRIVGSDAEDAFKMWKDLVVDILS